MQPEAMNRLLRPSKNLVSVPGFNQVAFTLKEFSERASHYFTVVLQMVIHHVEPQCYRQGCIDTNIYLTFVANVFSVRHRGVREFYTTKMGDTRKVSHGFTHGKRSIVLLRCF